MRAWIDHFRQAYGCALSGLQILVSSEVAARMELAGAVAGLVWIAWLGRSWQEIGGFVILCLLTLAVEALNTAIEAIVDEVSPQRSEFAGRAKDLGSAAVFLMLAACGLYLVGLTVASYL
ncbi:diacylglycerol kinase [Kaistia algarum]|uniref:diacylglycerol kinase n=1 Tax=Kaistia algarum TaxID=2083279 RepID=UPI000CE75424|nr:diacylglycerol kinase [Kaistia algarum]MCX5511951.1 diacylglycerol kinase [Kaistia algarum]PPE80083.1 diacylglycerol kinase [Kaistia algarum]